MRNARELLREVVGTHLASTADEHADLKQAGVGSGELIRLSLLIEDEVGRPLSEDEVVNLHSLYAIDKYLKDQGSEA